METEYFDCECHSPEHILRVMYDDEDKNWELIYVAYQFYPHKSLFKRISIAIKYILNAKYNVTPWGDMILKRKDVPRLVNLLNKIANQDTTK